jgi:hypothetical protein
MATNRSQTMAREAMSVDALLVVAQTTEPESTIKMLTITKTIRAVTIIITTTATITPTMVAMATRREEQPRTREDSSNSKIPTMLLSQLQLEFPISILSRSPLRLS